jgi:glycosyltransferase involved in cell wall biosynthesis
MITPVRNGSRYISACLESVLRQSYPHVEHVVVDGASTDDTVGIVERYRGAQSDRVRLLSEPDAGACDAWNKGLRMARGTIIGWLGADDECEPGAIETVVSYFHAHEDTECLFGESLLIDEQGKTIGRYATRDFDFADALARGNPIPSPSAYYTRELVDAVGPMRTDLNACDYDFYLRVGRRTSIHRLPDVLSRFRCHATSVTSRLGASVYPEEEFRISREHGGGWWSPVAKRYYGFRLRQLVHGGMRKRIHGWRAAIAERRLAPLESVAVFGAALSGHRLAAWLTDRDIRCVCFIDNAPPPDGRFLGRPVLRPDAFQQHGPAVDAIVMATHRTAEVRAQCRRLALHPRIIDALPLVEGVRQLTARQAVL